jgi:Na+-driven multidrug efflux pump
MKRETVNKLMDILISSSAILILLGVVLRVQHYPYGNEILWIGFISQMLLSTFEITRLKRIIKNLESKKTGNPNKSI